MNILERDRLIPMQLRRSRSVSGDRAWNRSSLARSHAFAAARRRREHVLAWLAFIMLIVAWNATLRLDERVSPPRMRMTHAVELESELQTQSLP